MNKKEYLEKKKGKKYNAPGYETEAVNEHIIFESMDLNFIGYSDKLLPYTIKHKGWYTDQFCEETYRGTVHKLPSRNGTMILIPGYEDTFAGVVYTNKSDIMTFEIKDRGDDSEYEEYFREAALSADNIASLDAQKQYNYNLVWHEFTQASDDLEHFVGTINKYHKDKKIIKESCTALSRDNKELSNKLQSVTKSWDYAEELKEKVNKYKDARQVAWENNVSY